MAFAWFFLPFFQAHDPDLKSILTRRVSQYICFVMIPALMFLFFAAGRMTLLPLPDGAVEMNHYTGRAQGLLFPSEKASELAIWYNDNLDVPLETSLAAYADKHRLRRFTVVPSLFQNIVGQPEPSVGLEESSKSEEVTGHSPWNFQFEQYNEAVLREEHELLHRFAWTTHVGL